MILFCILIFFTSSILTAYYIREVCIFNKKNDMQCNLYRVTFLRVIIEGILFTVFGFLLCSYLFKLAKISIQYVIPEQNVNDS